MECGQMFFLQQIPNKFTRKVGSQLYPLLQEMVEHSLTLSIEDNDKKNLQNIRSNLLSVKPDPGNGYTSGALGKPEDKSSIEEDTKRHKLLSSCKQSFKKIVESANRK